MAHVKRAHLSGEETRAELRSAWTAEGGCPHTNQKLIPPAQLSSGPRKNNNLLPPCRGMNDTARNKQE